MNLLAVCLGSWKERRKYRLMNETKEQGWDKIRRGWKISSFWGEKTMKIQPLSLYSFSFLIFFIRRSYTFRVAFLDIMKWNFKEFQQKVSFEDDDVSIKNWNFLFFFCFLAENQDKEISSLIQHLIKKKKKIEKLK